MSSQSNILISQLIEDPNFEEDWDSEGENENIPMIVNGQINMRFGSDGGPDMINSMLNLPFYHLKSLCYQGYADTLNRFIDRIELFKDNSERFEREVSFEGRLFGFGVEYVAQLLSLSHGTQVFSLAQNGEDLWGEGEEPCHLISCYGEGKNLVINFEISENTDYSIGHEPEFFEKLKKKIEVYNETIITPEYKQYYITPLERGFSIKYNMVLSLEIIRYREQIKEQIQNATPRQLYEGFLLKEKDSIF